MSITEQISTFLQQGRANNVKELVAKALDEGLSAQTVLDEGLLFGMIKKYFSLSGIQFFKTIMNEPVPFRHKFLTDQVILHGIINQRLCFI